MSRMNELCEKYYELDVEYEAAKAKMKSVGIEMDELSKDIIDVWINEGWKGVSLEGKGSFHLSRRLWGTVRKSDTFFQYLRDNNLQNFISETVNTIKISAWASEEIENGSLTKDQLNALGLECKETVTVVRNKK